MLRELKFLEGYSPPNFTASLEGGHCLERRYVPPQEVQFGQIVGCVVDPHNEVFPFWVKQLGSKRATVIHIDDHSDMDASVKAVKQEEFDHRDFDVGEYARTSLSIASFISPAIHFGLVGAAYWINPRLEHVESYGRVRGASFVDTPGTVDHSGLIEWVIKGQNRSHQPPSRPISLKDFLTDISSCLSPIILDIDLDAFDCVTDLENALLRSARVVGGLPAVSNKVGEEVDLRIKKVEEILRNIPRPSVITVARSQTPAAFVPSWSVDRVESSVMTMLSEVYK